MTENNHQQPRALAPRKLEQTESLQTLNHWRTVVKNYFRRCQFYSFFLRPGLTWTSSGTRGFTINSETSGLKRSPEVLASDLEGFLSTIGTYLPFDYVTEKLLVETTNIESVWSIIYEIYDAELVTTNYLDYAFMTRESGETYRNFYNRLVGFTRQHLPQTRVSAEGVISPDGGEELTVGLLDSIAIHWLLSIDRRLINIIKTEFATQLKSKRLCEMIKPIATSIDELLARHDKKDQIVAIKSNNVSTSENNPAPQETYEENTSIETIVRRIERLEQDKSRGSNFQYRSKRNYPRKQDVCKHCQFINSQLHSNLDIRHSSKNCTKKKQHPINSHNTDQFQFSKISKIDEPPDKYLHLISVDPDNVLTEDQKEVFHKLNREFGHIFTPNPGRYNGSYGYIDNRLQFSAPPPPNSKTHIPNYAPKMNDLLAEKMDMLEEWGVLAEPEALGVSVEFVSPSLLVPKPEPNEFRVVTDFSSLNTYLKRVPNTSATIAQAKSRIARANFVIHLDFSNFFFQNGMQRQDICYLGTVHPYKGLRVYTCDPQGLKGASERSYEKLLRIFGDMIQNKRLAQMADGIHVLGNTVEELVKNYKEVLKRADACNFTFKPSKVIICPRNITLFGWNLRGNTWYPTQHTISALTNAPLPNTIKQLRSFLGSFKQLSATLPGYAVIIHDLEQLVGGKKSAARISWTDSLRKSFNAAKALAAHPAGITEPRPSDQLYTFSDYSAENNAVGGRLVIIRKTASGTQELVGGFFNTVLEKHKKAWLPCEGEAAGIRLVLDHFQNYIRESNKTTIHHTDSQPCVLAWKRSQRGAFSSSSRISSFLIGLSALPVELRYKPGKTLHTSDYASRHPTRCNAKRCQICNFVEQWQYVGDNASEIRHLTVNDVLTGKSLMPMTQRSIWRNIQKQDPIHEKLQHLINTRQLPESRKRRGDFTKIKLLHNLYKQGKLFIDNDDLIMIKTPEGHFNQSVISIPPPLFTGLMNALHLKLEHPSKQQLLSLVQRYFYSPGWRKCIEEVSSQCHQCASLKQLPKVLIQDSSSVPKGVGTNFAADVLNVLPRKFLSLEKNYPNF